jgi:hypothetical protein
MRVHICELLLIFRETGKANVANGGASATMRCSSRGRGVMKEHKMSDLSSSAQPNADGVLPLLMEDAGFKKIAVIPTMTGRFHGTAR